MSVGTLYNDEPFIHQIHDPRDKFRCPNTGNLQAQDQVEWLINRVSALVRFQEIERSDEPKTRVTPSPKKMTP